MTDVQVASVDPVLAQVRQVCRDAQRLEERGHTYYLIPALELGERVRPHRCDVLLRVSAGDGYASRLFFEQKVECNRQLNWNGEVFALQRRWFAFSWKVDSSAAGLKLLTAHLSALR